MKNYYFPLVLAIVGMSGMVSCWFGGGEKVDDKLFKPPFQSGMRAPAFPLVTVDPYFSAWLFENNLNDDIVRHWTGAPFPLTGILTVDDITYVFMGEDKSAMAKALPLLVSVMPTQTYYAFMCDNTIIDLIFTSPLLPDDLDLISTPVSYITYRVRTNDGSRHRVKISIAATSDWAVNEPEQEVEMRSGKTLRTVFSSAGTVEQPILQKSGDNVRIDWGYFYLAAGRLSGIDVSNVKKNMIFNHNAGWTSKGASGFVMLAYDDIYSIQYFKDNRPAYWRRDSSVTIKSTLDKAYRNYATVMERCAAFDSAMIVKAEAAGGREYAELCALVYRQAMAAHKMTTDKEGNLLFMSKENFSNGSIGTVDITYPSSPLFLLYNPELLKGMMRPIFYFSESGMWNKPFPAHDVGTYPLANGQTYGGDMPVEEAGNMLILSTAIATVEGNADFASQHWATLTTWAEYLLQKGLDPENQLCTDDFAGHLAHNANLSIKAILGIAGYGRLAGMKGDKATEARYTLAAKEMANKWERMADDGNHYRLTFDRPGTWSQKYNLVWDRVLDLNIFSPEIASKEVAFYRTKQDDYGLPLDCRETYTKSDWILWSAALTGEIDDFRALMLPVVRYANETDSRVPISDWHDTHSSLSPNFRARSVVGGYFMKILADEMQSKRNNNAAKQ